MKKRLVLFAFFGVAFAFVFVNSLSGVTGGIPSGENLLPIPLSDLLFGKTSDFKTTLSNIEEPQLPLALTLCEVLKHKALHHDLKLTPEAVESLKTAIEARIKTSKTVYIPSGESGILPRSSVEDFNPGRPGGPTLPYNSKLRNDELRIGTVSETAPGDPKNWMKIPAREIVVEGNHLVVPEHYLALEKFAITNFSPQGEAGTLLPDVRVTFAGGKTPITASFLLDGRKISGKLSKNSFVYRPEIQSDAVLKIGTHTAEVVLIDSSKLIASKSWAFTVGIGSVPGVSIPSDALKVGSFSIGISSLFPDSQNKNSVLVNVFETRDGSRILEYEVSEESESSKMVMKTTSLSGLRKYIFKGAKNFRPIVYPQTEYAFQGNTLNFSAVYVGEGAVIKTVWKFVEDEANGTVESPTASWVKRRGILSVDCYVTVVVTDAEGNSEYFVFDFFKAIGPILPQVTIWSPREMLVNASGTGDVEFSAWRILWEFGTHELIEGSKIDIDGKGIISVDRSRWNLAESEGSPVIKNPLATETSVIFSRPGFAEVVNEVKLTLTWGEERYEWNYSPDESGLYGAFRIKGKAELEQFPEGIIYETKRKINLRKIEVEIGENKQVIEEPDQLTLDRPWILARSKFFPNSDPLKISRFYTVFVGKYERIYLLPTENGFEATLSFPDGESFSKNEILCRIFLDTEDFEKKKSGNNRKDELDTGFYPVTEWKPVKAFPSPAELVQIEIEPPGPLTVQEGQKVELKGSIVPKPGMGSGKLTSTENTLDLLDGYINGKLDKLQWSASSEGKTKDDRNGSGWLYTFDSTGKTGKYKVYNEAEISVREKDTETVGRISGKGETKIQISAKLRIVYPREGYVIPENRPFVLKAVADGFPSESIEWKINQQTVGTGNELPVSGLSPGNYVILASLKNFPGESTQVEIQVFDWSFSLTPTSHVYLWEGKPIEAALQGISKIHGQSVSTDLKPVSIGNATVEPQPMTLFWKSEEAKKGKPRSEASGGQVNSRNISCTEPDKLVATCTFSGAGRFEAIGSHSIAITQPDGAKETHFSRVSGSLLGAIVAKADYSFSFEPKNAIVGTSRLFLVGSITLQINASTTIIDKEMPLVFDPPFEVVKPFFSLQSAISISEFNNSLSTEEIPRKDGEVTLNIVHFPDQKERSAVWKPFFSVTNGQKLSLPELKKPIKPVELNSALTSRLEADKSLINLGEATKIHLFFGPKGGLIDQQKEVSLFDGDYMVSFDKTDWFSNGTAFSGSEADVTFKRDFTGGEFKITASPTFFIDPREGREYGGKGSIFPEPITIRVVGETSWSLVPTIQDHLEKLGWADKTKEAFVGYYEGAEDHFVWTRKVNGEIATKSLAVGVESELTLNGVLEGVPPGASIGYEWVSQLDSTSLKGEVTFEKPLLKIPTPPKIGQYSLILRVGEVNLESKIGPIYVVWKINENFSKKYFEDCVRNSTYALKGLAKTAKSEELIATFHEWWWKEAPENPQGNRLKYGIKGGQDTIQVILKSGGMCAGLGNYYFKCLEAQGAGEPNILRRGYLLQNVEKPGRPENGKVEYWGGVIITKPGLGNTKPWNFPYNDEGNPYWKTSSRVLDKALGIPSEPFETPIVSFPDDVNVGSIPEAFVFLAPADGHMFILSRDGERELLYDPSFFSKPFEVDKGTMIWPAEPPNDDLTLISMPNEINRPLFYEYFDKAVEFLRCRTYVKSLPDGLTKKEIIDVPTQNAENPSNPSIPRVNYLKLKMTKYDSQEERQP